MTTSAHTIVIGAGIAGLAYAHARGASADLLVLEAADRVGGVISTLPFEGGHCEQGPENLQVNAVETLALLGELGIALREAPKAVNRRFILRVAPSSASPGRLVEVPTSPGAFLSTPLLSFAGRVRALSEPFRARGIGLDGTVAEFVEHRLGREVLDWMVDPFVSGVYAGDPQQLSVAAVWPSMAEMVRTHGSLVRGMLARAREPKTPGLRRGLVTLAGGVASLPKAIGTALDDRLRLNTTALSLHPREGGWSVETSAGTFHAARVVVAVPAQAAARVLAAANAELAHDLRDVEAESVATVAHLWPRDRVRHALNGFGYLVPSRLGLRHLGTLFSSTLDETRCPPGTVLLRTFFGGARDAAAVAAPDSELWRTIDTEVAPVLGLSGKPLWSSVARWPQVLPRYSAAHGQRIARLRARVAAQGSLQLLGNYIDGVSVNALIERARQLARADAAD